MGTNCVRIGKKASKSKWGMDGWMRECGDERMGLERRARGMSGMRGRIGIGMAHSKQRDKQVRRQLSLHEPPPQLNPVKCQCQTTETTKSDQWTE